MSDPTGIVAPKAEASAILSTKTAEGSLSLSEVLMATDPENVSS
jgi:hypothetical protein